METQSPKFRVLIVGGSVAGLTLAHCLTKYGIEFTLLEANKDIAPQVGASIGIMPNGARILDQIGVFDDIMREVEPLKESCFWSGDKKLILQADWPQTLHER
jgi:2-polyprenyl-6-methoxyphenol hydroxylase-like FAD-dependent oxidoreductase